jgi:large repetitive protein
VIHTRAESFDAREGAAAIAVEPGTAAVTIPDAHFLFTADFKRKGSDLVLTGEDGRKILVPDYFRQEKQPDLVSPEGAILSANVVGLLAGTATPGQYAQAGAPAAPQPIGRVETVAGSATAVRNGVAVELNAGDLVFQGDAVQTLSNSTLAIAFSDGSAFTLNENARMTLNEFVYDPNSTSNSALINLVQGTVSFVAAQVAKTGNMRVDTPTATLGIRGTFVTVSVSSTDGHTVASLGLETHPVTGEQFAGAFTLTHRQTNQQVTVSDVGTMFSISPAGTMSESPKPPGIHALEQATFQALVPVMAAAANLGAATGPSQGANQNTNQNANPNATQDNPSGQKGGDQGASNPGSPSPGGSSGANPADNKPAVDKLTTTSPSSSTTPADTSLAIHTTGNAVNAGPVTAAAKDKDVGPAPPSAATAPPAPPPTPTVSLAQDTGSSGNDLITKSGALNVSGVVAGATVAYSTDGGATWSSSLQPAEGVNTVLVRQTDAAGNSNPTTLSFTLDTHAAAPSVPVLVAMSDSFGPNGTNADNITKNTTPTVSGSGAEAGATVTLYDTDGTTALGTATVDGSGNWTITSSNLADGDHSLTVKQTDIAGNTSAASGGLTVHIDTAAALPSAPDLAAASDSGKSSTDNITNDNTPTVSGSGAEAGATVTLYDSDGTKVLGTATADVSGKWTITSSSLADGDHSLTAKQTDIAGNTSTASAPLNVIIDTTADAGAALALSAASATGGVNADAVSITLSGIDSDIGSGTITLSDGSHTATHTLTAAEIAAGTVILGAAAFTGFATLNHTDSTITVSASLTDDAGNSAAPTNASFKLDTTAPSLLVNITDDSLNSGDNSSLVTFNFSEAPVGFTAGDIVSANGTISNFTMINATHYTATFTATDGFSGTGSVSVAADSYTDDAGNAGNAGSDTVAIDATSISDPNDFDSLVAGYTDPASTVVMTNDGTFVYGTNQTDTQSGNDTLNSGNANQTIYGGSGNDTIRAGNSTDTVYGGSGNDSIFGNNGGDTLYGGSGDDTITGGNGADTLVGGLGADTLVGGSGGDTFVFAANFGHDTITLFHPETDVIEIDHTVFADFQALLAATQADGDDVVITADPNDTITIKNVTVAQLIQHQGDFHFT